MRFLPLFLATGFLFPMLLLPALSQPIDPASGSDPFPASPPAFSNQLDYTLYHGGTKNEFQPMVRVDRMGNVLVCGQTQGSDFPQIPFESVYPLNSSSVFVAKFRPDGDIIFSRRFGTRMQLLDASVGAGDDVILLVGGGTALDTLVTPGAQWTTPSPYGILVVDSSGGVKYASYIRTDGLQEIVDMETDSNGDIYMLAHTYHTPPMVTQDALFPVNQGSEDGFIMKFSGQDYGLIYATCFGGTGHEEYTHIATDGCSIAIAGITWDDGGYPLVNPVQDAPAGNQDFIVSRLSGDGQQILYSTYIGGSGREVWARAGTFYRRLRFDQDGNLYFIGETSSTDFPVTHTIGCFTSGVNDIVLCKFSPTGDLLLSTMIGSTKSGLAGAIDIDNCGNVILTGTADSDGFVLRDPFLTRGNGFLMVIDTETPDLLFSTRIGDIPGSPRIPSLILNCTTAYLSGSTSAVAGMPATPGFPSPQPNGYDVFLSSVTMANLCPRMALDDFLMTLPEISLDMQAIDTLFIDVRRGVILPAHFPIDVTIRNLSTDTESNPLQMSLRLPDETELLPGSPSVDFEMGVFQPREERTIRWLVRPLLDSIIPQQEIWLEAATMQKGPCPARSSVRLRIPVVYRDLAYAELICDVGLRDSILLTADETRLREDTAVVQVRITNLLDTPAPLHAVRLDIEADAGVSLLDPPDPVMQVAPIPPMQSVILQWKVRVLSWQFDRSVHFTAVVIDTFGFPMQACETNIRIPGAPASICAVQAPTRISCLPDGSFDPSPVTVRVTVENPSDTTRFYSGLSLDLSSAPNLRPVTGDSLTRDDFYIRERFRRVFEWHLEVPPGLGASTRDTIRCRYVTVSDGAMHFCEREITLLLLSDDVSCGIMAEDELALDPGSGTLMQDTIPVKGVVWNAGTSVVSLAEARLSIPVGQGATVIGDPTRPLVTLRPGERDTADWMVHVHGYPHARTVSLTMTAFTADVSEVTHCIHDLRVPAVQPFCRVDFLPDSVFYDVTTQSYTPATFELSATLTNPADSALGFIRAEVDTTGLTRALLLSPPSAERTDLLPNDQWEVRWRFEPLWADRPDDIDIPVRFRLVTMGKSVTCSDVIHIDGEPLEINLQCGTAGHDSVWADRFYERLIPNPVQVQYSFVNMGNTTVSGCEIAILPPPMLDLIDGQDSIRFVPELPPGARFDAEWLLAIAEDRATPGPWMVHWQSACGDSVLDLSCDLRIGIAEHPPQGVVASPWLLRFEAEKDGPLPGSKTVDLWTGGGTEPRWSVSSTPLWLDAQPLTGDGHVTMHVQPNTTALPVGTHRDDIGLSVPPLRTGHIQVRYSIRDVLTAGNAPVAGRVEIGGVYPHPVRAGRPFRVECTTAVSSGASLIVHDLLGREISMAEYPVTQSANERYALPVTIPRPGMHLLTLRSGTASATRLIMVIP
ncbi:MAG: hypothetical protein JXA28_03270 [Bacteroidetes bacterium]|nr:hypothetical protein [Bacteroidota bacterium]